MAGDGRAHCAQPASPAPADARGSHFRLRPALAALHSSFVARRRAQSVSTQAPNQLDLKTRASHFARFTGLGGPRQRAESSASLAPPNVERCQSELDFAVMESSQDVSRAPRIPSFHLDSEFKYDFGLDFGLNPRFSTTSIGTIRPRLWSVTEEAKAPNNLFARDHDELLAPPASYGRDLHPWSASAPCLLTQSSADTGTILDEPPLPVIDSSPVAAKTSVLHPATVSTSPDHSHARRENDLYFEHALSATSLPSISSGSTSPVALLSPAVSPTRSTFSPARSTAASPLISPSSPILMGATPPSPVRSLSIPVIHTSPSHPASIPFPSFDNNDTYAGDDTGDLIPPYTFSRHSACNTPTLYSGTTNTSTVSMNRPTTGDSPSTFRSHPGSGAGMQGVVVFAPGDSTNPGLLGATENGPTESGRVELEKDGDSLLKSPRAESSGRSVHAESSGRSTHAESSQSGRAGSSIGTGIRARVSSLRPHQTLSALIPAFMKRGRRKSTMTREENNENQRGRREKKQTGNEKEVRGEHSRLRTQSRAELSRPRTASVSSACPASDDEPQTSPTSSHLDLLSPDPFASSVALKVGAWSEMYAAGTSHGQSPGISVRNSSVSNTFSGHLPPIIDSTSRDSLFDNDSDEKPRNRIYPHSRGRSLSQPDVCMIPTEPLHQSTTTRRSPSSLGGRRKRRSILPPRPSLPSLSTLSQATVVVPMPLSTAAARFPAEPWDAVGRDGGKPEAGFSRPSSATRGLGSLTLPVRMRGSSPARAPGLFQRPSLRSRMGSESSIAEDEDEDEDDTRSQAASSAVGDAQAWWSDPSSSRLTLSSRRGSFRSLIPDDENDEPTVSMPLPASNDNVAEGDKAASVTYGANRLSQGSFDVSSGAFVQNLARSDSPTAVTPPPSDRSESESSCDPRDTSFDPQSNSDHSDEHSGDSETHDSMPTGVGPRHPKNGAGGPYGGDFSGYSSGYPNHTGSKGGFGGQNAGNAHNGSGAVGNGPRRPPVPRSGSNESSSGSEQHRSFARRGRDIREAPTVTKAVRSQSMPRQAISASARAANRRMVTDQGQDSSDESDEVPLAQRIPTALKAQKSIRVQDRAEREERRQKRAEKMRRRFMEKAAPTGGEGGVAADQLARLLMNVQLGNTDVSRGPSPLPMLSATGSLFPVLDARSRTVSNVSHMSRSRTHTRNVSNEQSQPAFAVPQVSVARSGTMSARRPSAPEVPLAIVQEPRTSLSRSGTTHRHRGGSKTDDEGESSRIQRSRSIRDPSVPRPPVPPMPPVESLPMASRRPSQQEPSTPLVVEHRIYIGDRQKFVVVDVGSPELSAKDVIDAAKQRGELEVTGAGGWQLWEQCNESGMERPIRDFEHINDVLKVWNPEKRVNVLIIRRSQFCGLLKPENIPSSSPTMAGWVMWSPRSGKWNKRWLELKAHNLYISKSEKGKDQTFLCGLFNFDGYIVTHMQRAPKEFVFAAKSTDGSGVFEKEEDSVHVFCCDREIGEVWLSKILLARSYVLQQERMVLSKSSSPSSLAPFKSLLSRSATKISAVSALSSRTAASQNSGPLIQDLNPSPFVEGSLLAKATAGI